MILSWQEVEPTERTGSSKEFVYEPTVVVLGRKAFSTRRMRPESRPGTPSSQGSPVQQTVPSPKSDASKETVFVINNK
eukprot:scaffold131_cov34-Prasinocladus_malaysianus.AAC.1